MGAALHLAEVHQAPPGPKRKRKGGGGGSRGDRFYKDAQRIYSDGRATPEVRHMLLAFAYAVVTAPPNDAQAQWDLIRRALGQNTVYDRLDRLIRDDIPRYVSPEYQTRSYDNLIGVCSAARTRPYRSRPWTGATTEQLADQARRDQEDFRNTMSICGDTASEYVVEKMPDTGWHKLHYFCQRHSDHLVRVRAQVREQNEAAPEPIPNAGGLLPSYFDADWEAVYRHRRPTWKPPVYGIRADDWPVPGKEPVPPRARLRLILGDGLGGAGQMEGPK